MGLRSVHVTDLGWENFLQQPYRGGGGCDNHNSYNSYDSLDSLTTPTTAATSAIITTTPRETTAITAAIAAAVTTFPTAKRWLLPSPYRQQLRELQQL